MKKDAEAEKKFGELRVKTLEETAAHQQAQIAALEKQLADAKQQVQDSRSESHREAPAARGALAHQSDCDGAGQRTGRRGDWDTTPTDGTLPQDSFSSPACK